MIVAVSFRQILILGFGAYTVGSTIYKAGVKAGFNQAYAASAAAKTDA